MKKILLTTLITFLVMANVMAAPVKKNQDVMLDFTLNYKSTLTQPPVEHDMKNSIGLKNGKWVVAGKLQNTKSNDLLLVMVRLMSHKNNKFNLEFMLVDSQNQATFVSEPHIVAIAGLPVQLFQQEDGKNIRITVLVNLSGEHKS
jgi:hypothetical protein